MTALYGQAFYGRACGVPREGSGSQGRTGKENWERSSGGGVMWAGGGEWKGSARRGQSACVFASISELTR